MSNFLSQLFSYPEVKFLEKEQFRRMFLLAYQKIEESKEDINKINVFPVPDQDTGTNLSKTLEGPKKAIEKKEFKDLSELSKTILEEALFSAQGNAGVIYTGFLIGFLKTLETNNPLVDAKKLSLAFEEGEKKAKKSIQNPKEGTILDVISATSLAFQEKVKEGQENIVEILTYAIQKAKEALLKTQEKLPILKKANVVDAGGFGFLVILESWLEAIAGLRKETKIKRPSERVKRFIQIISNRWEVVCLIENPRISEEQIKEKLKRYGNSLDIVGLGEKIKIHIHTDWPKRVKETLKTIGRIAELKIQDMAKEIVGEESLKKVSIGIVTDNVASLSPKIIERYKIELAEVKFSWPEIETLPGQNIYQKILEAYRIGIKSRPQTTQATPQSYLEAFKKQLQRFEKVLCITLSSKISGCFSSAVTAKEELLSYEQKNRVFIFDSQNAAGAQALFVLRAIELIQEGQELEEILKELEKLIPQTHLYIIFPDPSGIEFIGRITPQQAKWIRRMKKIGFHPIIQFKDGLLAKGGIVYAKDISEALAKKVLKETKKARRQKKKTRVVINHADNLEGAQKIKSILKKKIDCEVSFISEGSPVVCAVIGPGTLIVSWQAI